MISFNILTFSEIKTYFLNCLVLKYYVSLQYIRKSTVNTNAFNSHQDNDDVDKT